MIKFHCLLKSNQWHGSDTSLLTSRCNKLHRVRQLNTHLLNLQRNDNKQIVRSPSLLTQPSYPIPWQITYQQKRKKRMSNDYLQLKLHSSHPSISPTRYCSTIYQSYSRRKCIRHLLILWCRKSSEQNVSVLRMTKRTIKNPPQTNILSSQSTSQINILMGQHNQKSIFSLWDHSV